MDAIALLPTGAVVPTDASPSVESVPGGAFAAAFVAAMDVAPSLELPAIELPAGSLPVVAAAPILPPLCPLPLTPRTSLPAAGAEAPAVASGEAPVNALPEPVPRGIGVEGDAPLDASPAEALSSGERRIVPARPPNERCKVRLEPPPLARSPVAPEKEAPTPAPNAPVAPLDRSSEASPPDEAGETLIETATASVPPQAASAPEIDAPARPKKTQSGPAQAAAVRNVAAATPPSAPVPSSPVASASMAAPAPVAVATESVGVASDNAGFAPVVAVAELATKGPAPTLAPAPDLDAVPLVVAAPLPKVPSAPLMPTAVAPLAPPAAPMLPAVPNEQVARVAAERTVPLVPVSAEKPAPKVNDAKVADSTATVLEVEAAVVQIGSAKGDDAPSDDDPSQQPALAAQDAPRTVATERPDAGVDRPSVDRHLVVRQVADRIESLVAARPKDGVTVHLEPRDLGTITLVVKGLSSALDVQVTASDDRVRQSLDASRPELAQALAPRGIELREMRVAVAPPAAGGSANANAGSGGRPSPEGQARQQSPTPLFVKPSRTEARAPRPTRSSGRGVDLLV